MSSSPAFYESIIQPAEGIDLNIIWSLRAALLILAIASAYAPSNIVFAFDNVIVRLLVVLIIVSLALIDPISSILYVISFIVILYQLQKYKQQYALAELKKQQVYWEEQAENFDQEEETEGEEKETSSSQQVNVTVPIVPPVISSIQDNRVGDEQVQNTEVRTWANENGPQGFGNPSGFNCMSNRYSFIA